MATYYIDFASGSDTNNGTSTSTPWKTVVGTRNTGDTAWQTSDWGSGTFNSSNKVPAGTIFKIKSGSTHDSSNGGVIIIDDTYYDGGTDLSRITFERDTTWGTGVVTFDGTGITAGIGLFLVQIDGIDFDGIEDNGIIVQDSQRSGIYVKEIDPGDNITNYSRVENIKFYNNGTVLSTDTEGAGTGQLQYRKINGALVNNCEFDGNSNYINGVIVGNNGMASIDVDITNCLSYDHLGDDDCGNGFKAFNSQIKYNNCVSYGNYKGFDLGEQSGNNADITYKVINSEAYSNTFGINMNCAASASYTGTVLFYIVNCVVRDNSFQGSNIYASPFKLYLVHNTYYHNGSDTATLQYQGNIGINPNSETDLGEIEVYMYNNIFYKPVGYCNFLTKYGVDANDFSVFSDYNSWVEAGDHINGETFCRWSYYESPAVDFAYGSNGIGQTSGNYYNWYNTTTTPPVNGSSGHYNCDPNSKGTSSSADTTTPPFNDIDNDDCSLSTSYAGYNISGQSWYIEEMGTDKNGNGRINWDIGACEYISFSNVYIAFTV